ncbi:MAG: ABC-type multidrug transport system ATPase subunit, partial [Polyangiales bacterium]
ASVFRIADQITFLYYGEVYASGPPAELLEHLDGPTMEFVEASGVDRAILDKRTK